MNPEVPAHLMRLAEFLKTAQSSLSPLDQKALIDFLRFAGGKHAQSEAQILQDLFVLYVLRDKRDGYFIEFGATDGLRFSNSYLLEKSYGWRGIAAEPARCWHEKLQKNRGCALDFRCVWTETGKSLEFNETATAEYSTINSFSNSALPDRVSSAVYPVETISLNDLLAAHNAPAEIDYLSIDTEGSELAILKAFDFSRHRVKIITVEHNFTEPARQTICSLLSALGFVRVLTAFSCWDDWYVHYAALAQSPLAR